MLKITITLTEELMFPNGTKTTEGEREFTLDADGKYFEPLVKAVVETVIPKEKA